MGREDLIAKIIDTCVVDIDKEHLLIHLGNMNTEDLEEFLTDMNGLEYKRFENLLNRKCGPFIYMDDRKEDPVPVLVLSFGNYLSWFRGYRFQVSATIPGVGCNGCSSSTLEVDSQLAKVLRNKGYKEIANLVILSHVMQACIEDETFRELYENKECKDSYSSLVNDFMELTDKFEYIGIKDFNIDSIKNSLRGGQAKELDIEVFYINRANEKKVLYEIGINKDTFEFAIPGESLVSIVIPKKDELSSDEYEALINRLYYVGIFVIDNNYNRMIKRFKHKNSDKSYSSIYELMFKPNNSESLGDMGLF